MRLTVYFPEDSPTMHEFVGDTLTVGRLGDNEVQIEEGSVSSRHAEIIVQDGSAVLRDLGSTNGTFLNREQVTGEHPLNEGDEIYFGSVRCVFMEPAVTVSEVAAFAAAGEPMPAADANTDAYKLYTFALPRGSGEPRGSASASGNGVPENFVPLSPFPKPAKPRDMLGLAAWGSFGVGVAAALYALFAIFTG
jgi:predicted component of type VI protein secretion system